jgi:hypothetical protein
VILLAIIEQSSGLKPAKPTPFFDGSLAVSSAPPSIRSVTLLHAAADVQRSWQQFS